ncbi:hypothetical protein J1605_008184 [Eschrichtius robustus]|uniref:Uncharacterized protein n=1 Tax=Eschrichtius robustus TaxID=9764 RepID=A0AB34GVM3_ESCRO|nr:hypothetical protein J1605_008184 [Eschrichtius robustus]
MYERRDWVCKDREQHEEMMDYLSSLGAQQLGPCRLSSFPVRRGVQGRSPVPLRSPDGEQGAAEKPGQAPHTIQQITASSTQRKRVMLAVCKHNRGAYRFFREALQCEIADSPPSVSGCYSNGVLSRRTKCGDSQHSHAGEEQEARTEQREEDAVRSPGGCLGTRRMLP